mmetsp:Transcript_123764/g.219363  ORF Transcript_123764/g.219363 Transcript_123764/m.219363 type:complete len:217 (+) Transcript_123764:2464-3114(+)
MQKLASHRRCKMQRTWSLKTIIQPCRQGSHTSKLCVVCPHLGKGVHGLLLQGCQLLLHRGQVCPGFRHRASVVAAGRNIEKLLRIAHGSRQPINGKPQGKNFLHVVLQARIKLCTTGGSRLLIRIVQGVATELSEDMVLHLFQNYPLWPTLDLAVPVLLGCELDLNLIPDLREQLAARLHHAVAAGHEEDRHRILCRWCLCCRGGKDGTPDNSGTE